MRLKAGGDSGLAKVFLREDISGDLRPIGRDFNVLHREKPTCPVRVADFAGPRTAKLYVVVRIAALDGKKALDAHVAPCRWSCGFDAALLARIAAKPCYQ